jgi:hypothetical protein
MQRSLDELLAGGGEAAEETQAIDTAFQERVKRNYEMLSEAVQLMGVVAQGGQGAAALRRQTAARRPEPAFPAPAPAAAAAPEPPPITGEDASGARLKFTPLSLDETFDTGLQVAPTPAPAAAPPPAALPQAAPPPQPEPEPEGGWTWKELLTSIDGDAAPEDMELGAGLSQEVEGMGIDPAALLSRARIEEIAAAIQTKDLEGAREVVRTLAPAAIRRLSRRLIGDGAFRSKAQSYVRRYAAVLEEAARRDHAGFQAASLLNSSVGRVYLLLDAAGGDQA